MPAHRETLLGRYRTIATIGQGGMARVYLTVSQGAGGFNKLFVVKELRTELLEDRAFVDMFLDEARLAAQLSHPNIVQTYEVGSENGRHFIAMEYLEGNPLHEVIARDRAKIPLGIHLRILVEVLAALHAAHEAIDYAGQPLNVVHRDVSPQNVFVCYDGRVKLLDFGIAKAIGTSAMTEAGTLKGKIGYLAPEQALGTKIDRRADLFAVGVLLWEALSRQRFTRSEPEVVVLQKRVNGTYTKIEDVAPDAPPSLIAICNRAMASEPKERYATALEFEEALTEWLSTSSKRCGTREIGAYVSGLFSEEKAKMRSLVEACISEASSVSAPNLAQIRGAPVSSATESHSGPHPLAVALSESTRTRVEGTRGRASKDGPKVTRIAVGVAALSLVVGVAGTRLLSREATVPVSSASGPPPPAVQSVKTASPSGSATTGDPTTAETATPAPTASFEIAAEPPSAQIFVDGALASNPFRAQVTSTGGPHKLRIAAPGFVTEERVIAFDSPRTLQVSLARDMGGHHGPAPGPGPAPGSGLHAPTAATSTATTTPPDSTTKPPTHHTIDDTDPYK
jgi:serine/threonine-protein kinase